MTVDGSQIIRVVVSGSAGKMGQEVIKTVINDPQLQLVGAVDKYHVTEDAALVAGVGDSCQVQITPDLSTTLRDSKAQVCVDFTHPDVALKNTLAIIEAGCRPVVGTTGFSKNDLETVRHALASQQIGGMIVPNFAIGAVLLMKFAEEASRYLDHAEIIELHHNQKADAPSGTAVKTAEKMLEGLKQSGKSQFGGTNSAETEILSGSRGGTYDGNLHIHSVRLPGLVAHQEVIFGGPGQMLTIRHDSIHRTSFMPGVALACKKVMNLERLVYGLEHVL